jgi:hypothetical protein
MKILNGFLVCSLSIAACAKSDSGPEPQIAEVPQPEQAATPPQQDSQDWQNTVTTIWSSPLGIQFKKYLATDGDSENIGQAASTVTDRVFSDADHELLRLAGLQTLVEDIYSRGQHSQDVQNKVAILEMDIGRRALTIARVPEANASSVLPYLILISLVGGSPEVQTQLREFLSRLYEASHSLIFHGELDQMAHAYRAINMRRIFSYEFFRNYSPLTAAASFISVFPPGLSLYYLAASQNPELVGHNLGEQISRFGKEHPGDLANL